MTDEQSFEKQLTRGWEALSPPAGLKARVRARLPLAAGSGASDITVVRQGLSRWSALRASGAIGVGVGGLLLGLGFAAGYLLRSDVGADLRRARTDLQTPASAVALETPASTPLPSGPGEMPSDSAPPMAAAPEAATASTSPAPSSSRRSVPVREQRRSMLEKSRGHGISGASAHAPAADAPSAAEELALLGRAERAVRARNAALALSLSETLDERYPRSTLQEERQAIALMARCQAGAHDSRPERERFTRQYPHSVYAERIDGECGVREPALRGSSAESLRAPTNATGVDMNAIEGGKHAQPKSP